MKQFDLIHTSIFSYIDAELPKLSAAGIRISYDFSNYFDQEKLKEVCPYLWCACLSSSERSDEENVALAKETLSYGCHMVLITCGERGAMLAVGDHVFRQSPCLVQATDTMGAGDSFISAFLVSYLDAVAAGRDFPPAAAAHGIVTWDEFHDTLIRLCLHRAAVFSANTCLQTGSFGYGHNGQNNRTIRGGNDMLVLKGRVIDGNGGEPIEKGVVAIGGNKITAVCKESEYRVPECAEVIEVADGTIMPGFIDQHVHMGVGDDYFRIYRRHAYHGVCEVLRDMKQILNAGFTSIREVGGISNYLKAPWDEGLIDGPRICSAGRAIAQTGGHWDYIKDYPVEFARNQDRNLNSEFCDGVDQCRYTARMHFREHCDFLKLMGGPGISCQGNKIFTREFSDDELRAFVQEAENFGTYVAIHAHAPIAINAALRCGVKSIEHASLIDDEGIDLMLKNDAWMIPTLATSYLSWQHIDEREPWVKEKMSAIDEMKKENLKKAHKAGVKIGCGCDFGGGTITVHGNNGLELPLLVQEAGMTPMEAIVAATKFGAALMMRPEELGTLEEGKLADVIIAKGNPLEDIWLVSKADNIKIVIQDGVIKKRIA